MTASRKEGVSPKTDELASTLLGVALDRLAAGEDVNVLLVVGDARGTVVSYELADDDAEKLLDEVAVVVRRLVSAGGDPASGLAAPVRYALAYEGAVEVSQGVFADAAMLEFGEVGYRAYSAFATYGNRGGGDRFVWDEAAPAGEVEPLL